MFFLKIMKILHLITDHQVVERTLENYERLFPGSNKVLVFSESDKLKHLKTGKDRIIVSRQNIQTVSDCFDFTDIKYIIAHYLTLEMVDFVKSAPDNIHFCWAIYGGDLYNQFLEPQGYKIYYSSPNNYIKYGLFKKYFPELFDLALLIKGHKYLTKRYALKAFEYVNSRVNSLLCCDCDAEIYFRYSQTRIPHVHISSYSLHETFGELYDYPFVDSKNILVGNSASFSNNHLYALKFLKKMTLPEARLKLILSYGGSVKYRQEVLKQYQKHFNGKIDAIIEYLPLHEYNKIFTTVGVLILPAWRQESVGTIMMGLNLGLKIFLSQRNPLYKYFIDMGFVLFDIESANAEFIRTPLSLEQKQYNRNKLRKIYDEAKFENSLLKKFTLCQKQESHS